MTNWSLPDDPTKKGMKYPNYHITKTPSGHELIYDDSEGYESITLRHRSGSSFQLNPDGAVVMTSKNGKYEVTFGDNNMLVTGAHNMTVNGPASMRVEGNYDMTVAGNMKQTINGNIETVCNGDMTTMVSGQSETVIGGDQSTKVAGSSEHIASKAVITTEGNLGLLAGSNIVQTADNNINQTASGGDITQTASSSIKQDAGSSVAINSNDLTHNSINVGSDHAHGEVMSGGDVTGPPVG